ncbi:MAG: hypothetical protein K9F92_02340 [Candidatus Nanopelagicaceae bacterium]|nr:hypothetical protein [Candidatus Nanopelagicaceae bacterium]
MDQHQVNIVDEVKLELSEIDSLEVEEHGQRYEALHQKLNQALTSIDGL